MDSGQNGDGSGFNLCFFYFLSLITIPQLHHTLLSSPPLPLNVRDSSEQAAHYHILGI
jgi:hypothetical protein